MATQSVESLVGGVDRMSRAGLDLPGFLAEATSLLSSVIPAVATCVATHDPATRLMTGVRKYGDLLGRNKHDALYGQIEYASAETTNYRALMKKRLPAVGMSNATRGDVRRSIRMRDLVIPHFGYGDEARLVFRDGTRHWGVLALFRGLDDPAYTPTEIAVLSRVAQPFARGVRRGILAGVVAGLGSAAPHGPAVIIVDRDDEIVQLTPNAEARLARLSVDRHSGSPSGVLAALIGAARSHARGDTDEPASARIRGSDGVWLTLQAVGLGGGAGAEGQLAITLDEARPPEIFDLVMTAYGLTPRERHVTRLVLEGKDTSEMVRELRLSPHTLGDHLKAIFAKTEVHTRGQLVARVFGDFYAPRLGDELTPAGSFGPEAAPR
jgi:DNA-binding CsgD family transcriptional regulator